ncbi:ATP-binding protein [Nonomuraea sp. NEAU-A123]|uniref:ATP-binding protein n=1 Tax=Nonomuraea sp. NEAU-A123 TaxID=2839649 RepID=UPI001BE3D59B|nr:ATP-binding protein [Nonomuraea sp. NEAU-A123]MBT2228841.1 ATP-binding protein [Nonomuraea sp. NEAU-A123]
MPYYEHEQQRSGQFLGEIVLPGVERSVSLARRCIAEILTAAGHVDTDDVRLVVSELTTNAVAHTASGHPGGVVTLNIATVDAATLCIEVIDEGATTVPEVREAEVGECGGRGLWLVEAFATRWGVRDGGSGQQVVWVEMSAKDGASMGTVSE